MRLSAAKAPIIGVTSSEIRTPAHLKAIPESEPLSRELCLGLPYLAAVQQVGGIPLVIGPLRQDAIDDLLSTVDAICLSGGPDLDPKTYGSPPHEKLGPTELAVDSFEIALARGADRLGMPILAICRGAQVLNVARGGTLFQHIPDEPGSELSHRQSERGPTTTHEVDVIPDTLLHAILKADTVAVNSFHHQSVNRLGKRLRVAARSKDGIVEGIEAIDRNFMIGVQWHAESLTDADEHERLFRGLTDAALVYRAESDAPQMRAV